MTARLAELAHAAHTLDQVALLNAVTEVNKPKTPLTSSGNHSSYTYQSIQSQSAANSINNSTPTAVQDFSEYKDSPVSGNNQSSPLPIDKSGADGANKEGVGIVGNVASETSDLKENKQLLTSTAHTAVQIIHSGTDVIAEEDNSADFSHQIGETKKKYLQQIFYR